MLKNFLPVFSLATVEGEVPDISFPGGGATPPPEIIDLIVPAWEAFHNSFKKVIDFSIYIFEFIIAQPILVLFVAGSIIPIGLGIIRIMNGTVD